ncbi:MAG: AbrB/MazE/SpoVT family DNA-binding domain-containing protein [Propionibacteriaceae bacterium]|jgi:AbrB family looped-hinge helix DNA binding protein|nr:AbrB/MazE/SpoVT family DNA-binding domain-containing protein [Propionibacteriaceae bacterium]
MVAAMLTSKGQITIPISVRNHLGLTQGSRIDFIWRDGVYVLIPSAHPVSRLAGYFGTYDGPPISIEQMNDAIADAMGEMP